MAETAEVALLNNALTCVNAARSLAPEIREARRYIERQRTLPAQLTRTFFLRDIFETYEVLDEIRPERNSINIHKDAVITQIPSRPVAKATRLFRSVSATITEKYHFPGLPHWAFPPEVAP